ncbi:hypothetical protein [Qipengyuania sp. NPDC077563]|uniref:hypothetical protein n=1 Tax=Qipengyuania sp. NPDC077563 TaxID=3364497 RepID=UPI00384D5729
MLFVQFLFCQVAFVAIGKPHKPNVAADLARSGGKLIGKCGIFKPTRYDIDPINLRVQCARLSKLKQIFDMPACISGNAIRNIAKG